MLNDRIVTVIDERVEQMFDQKSNGEWLLIL